MARYIDAEKYKLSLLSQINVCESFRKEYSELELGQTLLDAVVKTITLIVNDLDNLPTADVEKVRHGEWIAIKNKDTFRCSICEKINDNNSDARCPFCGAKMDGGHDDRKAD